MYNMLRRNILSIYFVAGYPFIDSISIILSSLERCGVDFIEIGIPYSDSLADGNTIYKLSKKSLTLGMNLYILFNLLKKNNYKVNCPLILMGYFNQFIKFGEDLFLKQCILSGIFGLILPDLPVNIYINKYRILFTKYQLSFMFLVCSNTSNDRIVKLSKSSNVFLYLVSSLSTTGKTLRFGPQQFFFFKRINHLKLNKIKLLGFGINDNKYYKLACDYADGVIIGSAFIKALNKYRLESSVIDFIKKIK